MSEIQDIKIMADDAALSLDAMKTALVSLKGVMNEVKGPSIDFGEAVKSVAENAAKVPDIVSNLAKLDINKMYEGFTDNLLDVAVNVEKVNGVLGKIKEVGISGVLGDMKAGFSMVGGSLKTLGGTVASLLGPHGLIIAGIIAIVAAVTLIVTHWDKIKEVFQAAWDWFKTNVVEPISELFTFLWDGIKEAASAVWEAIVSIWTVVSTWFMDNIITPLVEFFTGLWESIKELAGTAWDGIVAIWTVVSTWFMDNIITPLVEFFTGLWDKIKELAGAAWDSIVEVWNTVCQWFMDNIITPLVEFFTGLWDSIKELAGAAWDGIVEIWNVVTGWFTDTIITPLTTFFTELWDNIKEFASGAWDKIKEVWATVTGWFQENVIDCLVKAFKGMANKVIGFFGNIGNGIVGILEKAINWVIDNLNKIQFDLPDWLPGKLGGMSFGINIPRVSLMRIPIPTLFAGGFVPSSAQLFMARENGIPEMVGRIGSNTAVANNDQIVAAIQQGVYQATVAAMRSQQVNVTVAGEFRQRGSDLVAVIDTTNRIQGKPAAATLSW